MLSNLMSDRDCYDALLLDDNEHFPVKALTSKTVRWRLLEDLNLEVPIHLIK